MLVVSCYIMHKYYIFISFVQFNVFLRFSVVHIALNLLNVQRSEMRMVLVLSSDACDCCCCLGPPCRVGLETVTWGGGADVFALRAAFKSGRLAQRSYEIVICDDFFGFFWLIVFFCNFDVFF
jgi:hypothetical protein